MIKLKDKRGANGLSPFTISLVATVLFAFCIIGFTIGFLNITNPSSEILNPVYGLNTSYNNMDSSMGNFTDSVNNIKGLLESSNPSPLTFIYLIFEGAFKIPMAVLSFAINGLGLLSGVLFSTLVQSTGGSEIIATALAVLIAGLVFTVVFLIIKAIRTGDSG